jgi:hypothetical protein
MPPVTASPHESCAEAIVSIQELGHAPKLASNTAKIAVARTSWARTTRSVIGKIKARNGEVAPCLKVGSMDAGPPFLPSY